MYDLSMLLYNILLVCCRKSLQALLLYCDTIMSKIEGVSFFFHKERPSPTLWNILYMSASPAAPRYRRLRPRSVFTWRLLTARRRYGGTGSATGREMQIIFLITFSKKWLLSVLTNACVQEFRCRLWKLKYPGVAARWCSGPGREYHGKYKQTFLKSESNQVAERTKSEPCLCKYHYRGL